MSRLILAVIGALAAVMATFAVPAQAAEAIATTSPATSAETRQESMMRKSAANDDSLVVAPNAIPDAYQVCGSKKCVWVEKTKYCPPSTGCGAPVVMRPYSGPAGSCSSSTGCATINGQNYQLYAPNVYDNGDAGKIARCAASVGLNAASYWTRGFSRLALAGTGLATWGCSAI